MRSKAKKGHKKNELYMDDGLDEFFDDDADLQGLDRRLGRSDWEDIFDADAQMTARRSIERKRDFMRLRSELDEWEQFGDSAGW